METSLLSIDFFMNYWWGFATIVASLTLHVAWSNRKLPPGPRGLPVLGYIPFFSDTPHIDLMEISRKYQSPVISMKLGFDRVVFLNDLESIQEVLSHDGSHDRPEEMLDIFETEKNIATWNGNVWKTQRKVSLKMLKDLGFGKTMFEGKILGEFNHLFDRINQLGFNGNSPVKFRRLLTPTVSNIINLMLSGHRYDFNHPIRRSIDGMFDLNNNLAKHLTFTSYMMFFSGIIRLLAYYAGSIAADIRWCQISLLKYIKQTIDDRSSSPNRRDDNFIDMYLKEINATSGDPKSIFTRENLYGCVVGFYVGGTGSTKDTLEWCLLLMAQYPDVQEKMRCEVDSIIGSERSPTHSDKHHMPYTQAVFWEVLRFSSVFPINLPHMSTQEINLKSGHIIPKGVMIFANLYAVHFNPQVWGDPQVFRPERFLSADGSTFIRSDHVIPFGYGKRSCPGVPLAESEMFLFMTSFLQRFIIKSAVKNFKIKPRLLTVTRKSGRDEELIFTPRNHSNDN